MAQQDVRYYLNGLLVEVSADYLRVVATDGHRLAVAEQVVGKAGSKTGPQEIKAIIPKKAAQEMLLLLEDGGDG